MDKSAIKNFAVWARKKLIEDIKRKACEAGINENSIDEDIPGSSDSVSLKGKTLNREELKQRESLISKIREKGYKEVVEEAAFTWFSRFIALRFMEINNYLPSGVRVLSSTEKGKAEPDIVRQFEHIDLGLGENDLNNLRAMADSNDNDNLYSFLLVKQCNKLNEILPGLFEKIKDYTEILLPGNLLAGGSVIKRLVSDISEEYFLDQVEIIGWLYQYYILEKKDEVFEGLKKNIKITKENIPAATQLFTPDWIVKYMVENSLGRLWLDGHPDDTLKSQWKYYLDEAEQERSVQEKIDEIKEQSKKIKPEDIKVLDPAMGTGHILVYAFDVLYEIYKRAGYCEIDIPKLILEKNLYGLEIDDRAAQLAYFAVMMKARSKHRGIFREKISLNLCCIQESNGIPAEALEFFKDPAQKSDVKYLIEVFQDAKEYGSILDVEPVNFDAIEERIEEIKNENLPVYKVEMGNTILDRILVLLKQLRIMSQKYDVVCANPPYMGRRNINNKLRKYIDANFKESSFDLYAVFISQNLKMTKRNSYSAIVTMQSWMFLRSFSDLRKSILNNKTFINLLHLGAGAFEQLNAFNVLTASFIIKNCIIDNYKGLYIRLADYYKYDEKINEYNNKKNYYYNSQSSFKYISGYPIVYWINNNVRSIFKDNKKVKDYISIKQGMATTDNNMFTKLWHEIEYDAIGFGYSSRNEAKMSCKRWFPYNKSGNFRKWYGNNENVVDYEDDGYKLIETVKRKYPKITDPEFVIKNRDYYFRKGITWSLFGFENFGVRYKDCGYIFDVSGSSGFADNDLLLYILGYLASKVAFSLLSIIAPTVNFQIGNVGDLPLIVDSKFKTSVEELVWDNIKISRLDWDSFETSWDFKKHPILIYKQDAKTIEQAFNNWSDFAENQFNHLKSNEEELNRIFIEIYGLKNELIPEEEAKDITIRKADRVRDIKSFISYAVGCMLGRYSIDSDGLIYAGGQWEDRWKIENGKYKVRKIARGNHGDIFEDIWIDAAFAPAEDNIIAIVDDEYFTGDIVSRFIDFIRTTFGDEALEENLNYIAEVIGRKSSETSRQAVRRYFLKDFYKDHVQTYQKRPIYWLFDSGKNDGFKALIYMQRYDDFTLSIVRTKYLHRLQRMYESQYNRFDAVTRSNAPERDKDSAGNKKERLQKQMMECQQYDRLIAHAANMRIKINLNDGVKVNYNKFQDIEISQSENGESLKADLLAKI